MISKPTAVEAETQDEVQPSESNRGRQQETEISELCGTLRSVVSALCRLIPVLEKLHDDIQRDQGLKRNIQDLRHESDLPKMETKSNSLQNQTPVSSNTTDIVQPATPDEPETPSLHQPSLPAHYGMNGGEEHQTPENITAPCKPVAAPLDAAHQTSALTKSDNTSDTSMLGTVSTVLTAPVPSEVASSPTTVGSAAPTFTNSSAFAPSSVVTTDTVDCNVPLISLPPAVPAVKEGPTVHAVVDEEQVRVQPPETEALQTPTPVSALPQKVPKSALVEPTQEAPAPSSSPSSKEAVVETPYCGAASSGLSTTVRGGYATPVFGQTPRIFKPQSFIKEAHFTFKPSTVPSRALLEPTQKEPGASICPSSQELILPSTAVKTPTSAVLSSGDFATPVFGQAPTLLGPESSMTTANLSTRSSTCGTQSGFGQFGINETSSSFGLQSGVNNTSSFGQSSGSTQINPSSHNMSPVNFSFHPTSLSRGRQSVRSQPDGSDVDFSFAPRASSTQSALDETPASSTFRRRRRHRRRSNYSSPTRSSNDVIPFAGREEMWSSSRTTSYIQSGRGRINERISVTVQNSSRSLINQSRNHSRGFVEQRRIVRRQEYYQEYLY